MRQARTCWPVLVKKAQDAVNDIQTEIDRLKMDPQSKNIVQYLRNQQSHLIREARALPQKYQVDENQLKR